MKGAIFNIHTLIINKLECFTRTNCMCKSSSTIGTCRLRCAHRNDFISNELIIVIQLDAEEISTISTRHVSFSRIQLSITNVFFMFFIEGNSNSMIYTIVFTLNKGGCHDIVVYL